MSPVSPPGPDGATWERDGWVLSVDALCAATLDVVRQAADLLIETQTGDAGSGAPPGHRRILHRSPVLAAIARSASLRALVEPILGPHWRPVRGLLFDKTPAVNWKVPWHQDRVIAVRERRTAPGYRAWSRKEGVWHVQPPPEVPANMLAVRLHLDDCGPDSGPLRVLPGSHTAGYLDPDAIRAWRARVPEVTLCAPAGAAILFRPLLLHASAAALRPTHRRVLHLEYAALPLPGGLEFAEMAEISESESGDSTSASPPAGAAF